MEKRRGAYSVLTRKPEEKASLGKQRSRWQDNMNVWDVAWNVLIWLSVGGWLAGSCEHGDEPSSSKTRAELLDYLRNKKDSVPWS
jgi:hypothetical protein